VQQGAAGPVVNRIQRSTAEPPVVQRLFGANAKKHVKSNSYPAIEATLAKAQQGAATEAEINMALKAVERHQKIAAKMKGGDASGQMATLRNLARYLGDELGFARDRIRMAATNRGERSQERWNPEDSLVQRCGAAEAVTRQVERYVRDDRGIHDRRGLHG
jgi:hypothetical protein